MIAQSQNSALLKVGEAAMQNPLWIPYGNYCLDREKGLRKQAFKHLDLFIESTQAWSLETKIEFVKFLLPCFENIPEADYGPFPYPLSQKLIKPTLLAWCQKPTLQNEPFRWYGTYYNSQDHLLKALELDPSDDQSRQVLLSRWTYEIYYSVHHLPDYYIGDPLQDLKLGQKVKQYISELATEELKQYWRDQLQEDLLLVQSYLDWKNSGSQDFQKWAQQNNRPMGYPNNRVYYFEK